MEDLVCPRCKTTKYRNPSLKLMVNVCGHALCDSCVDLLFLKGSGSCPQCNVPLRRNNFRVQLFEDACVEKEVDIRKRVLRDFNKKEEDFASLRDYNDYLEEVETIIFNLSNNIDVIETNRKIENYKKENRDTILKNKIKIGKEELELEELLEEEKHFVEFRKREFIKEELGHKMKKIREREALIDELMFSNADAKFIVNSFAQSKEESKEEAKSDTAVVSRANQFSTGIKFGRQSHLNFVPLPKVEDGPLYVYTVPEVHWDGPQPPDIVELESKGYLKHVRSESSEEKAGGFQSNIACLRALQEAFIGLYYVPEKAAQPSVT